MLNKASHRHEKEWKDNKDPIAIFVVHPKSFIIFFEENISVVTSVVVVLWYFKKFPEGQLSKTVSF